MPLVLPMELAGRHARLEPLAPRHIDGLLAAALEARDSYRYTYVPGDRDAMRAYVDDALEEAAAGRAVPFATIDATANRVVGATRFANPERWRWAGLPVAPAPDGPDAVEIGWTWLSHSAQRTAMNTEAKLLMLRHAFAQWRVYRVTLKTDARNERSRAAIARLGASLDGVLRAHMPAADQTVRDSAYYSIVRADWPGVERALAARLRAPA